MASAANGGRLSHTNSLRDWMFKLHVSPLVLSCAVRYRMLPVRCLMNHAYGQMRLSTFNS